MIAAVAMLSVGGCAGYQNGGLYPENIQTVYVEMFDTRSFRRGYEYKLTDAICKRLELTTPYKIVSDRDEADSVLSGTMRTSTAVLAGDRYTGRALERESTVSVNVTWKHLKTGQLLVHDETVEASASYSDFLGQDADYGIGRAVNKAAIQVVELMEKPW
jgi:hypothetical protein